MQDNMIRHYAVLTPVDASISRFMALGVQSIGLDAKTRYNAFWRVIRHITFFYIRRRLS